ncbi:hypothetical protein [Corynebacterium amycolatum]|nr:hypothetical protein [Corynebacterium amycolatum]STC40371.1 Uncharacterised protein [Corynebacterium amycolatum]
MTATTSALWTMTGIGAVALVIGWPVATAYRRHEANAAAEVQAASSTEYSPASTDSDRSRMEERRPAQAEASGASVLSILRIDGMSSAMAVSIAVIVAIDLLTAYVPVLGRELGFSVAEVTAILGA